MEKVSIGGFLFEAEQVTYAVDSGGVGTLTVHVSKGGDVDHKLYAMFLADLRNTFGFRYAFMAVALPAQNIVSGHAWFKDRSVRGTYRIGVRDLLPIYRPQLAGDRDPAQYPLVTVAATRCECGTGNHTRSSAHSTRCALYTTT